MADAAQEAKARKELQESLAALLQVTPESLVQKDKLGRDLNFEEGLPSFRRVIGLFESLRSYSFDDVPLTQLQQITGAVSEAKALFTAISGFNPRQQNPQERDVLIVRARDNYDQWFSRLSPVISYAACRGRDFAAVERSASEALGRITKAESDMAKRRQELEKEADEALKCIRAAASEAGVSQQAIYFRDEADHQRRGSYWWLAATIACAVAAVGFSGLVLHEATSTQEAAAPGGASTHFALQAGLAKLAILSILYYVMVWCARTYRACRHNHEVNQHRQNALSTFNAFVKATGDEQAKQAVLLEATKCVFAPQHTGFLGKEAPTPGVPNQILEILSTTKPSP